MDKVAPIKSTIPIDENQRQINRLLGIGDEVFVKYAKDLHSSNSAEKERAEAIVGTFHKAGDKVFATYHDQPEMWPGIIDDCQRKINEMCGVSDEAFVAGQNKLNAHPQDPSIDDAQRKINEMCGVDAETFNKYSRKGDRE